MWSAMNMVQIPAANLQAERVWYFPQHINTLTNATRRHLAEAVACNVHFLETLTTLVPVCG